MNVRFRQEVIRKTIHLSGLTVPLVYFYFGRDLAILYTSSALLAFLLLEFVRIRVNALFPFVKTATMIERQKEKTTIAAYVYFCIAAVVSIYFFSAHAAIVGLTASLVADAAAAVIGVGVGKHKLKSGKSLEGSMAGLASALSIAYILNCNLFTIIFIGLVFMLFDLLELGIDDNFTTPIAMVIVVQIFEVLL